MLSENDKPTNPDETPLDLLPQHLADLRKSGLNDDAIRAGRFSSVTHPEEIAGILRWKSYYGSLGACLCIPYLDSQDKPSGYCRLKPDTPRNDKEGKPIKYEAPKGKPNQLYIPSGTFASLGDAARPLLITEGEKKAAKADQERLPCLGLSGVWSWQKKRSRGEDGRAFGERELIDGLEAIPWQERRVFICFDSDGETNPEVRKAEWHLAKVLQTKGAIVKVVRLPSGPPGPDGVPAKVGLDDFLVANSVEDFRKLLDAAMDAVVEPAVSDSATGGKRDDRPTILITTEEHLVNDQAVAALLRDSSIFQRGGLLVRVVRDDSPAAKGIRRPFAPRIDTLPPPLLRERLAANARWVEIHWTKEGPEERPARPPTWSVAAVHARACWPGIRHLEAVVDYPVLRPDGTVLCRPGYDPETGLLLESTEQLPLIADHPTREDAFAARDALLEVVADFPFDLEVRRAAWLAGLLTPLARFAFAGPAPLFLVDANVRAAGKGLLLDCISRIVTGERFTIATYTSDEDELRKRITSLALAGDRLVLFDNLEGRFGNATLDAALTGTAWKDRILGVNRMAEAPLYMTWFATGNNVAVAGDTARRICHVRLESPEERPEERRDFHHPDLLKWVGENRSRLMGAALTILRAYCAAGFPDLALRPWGSFEGWSRLVRSAVVWVDLPDPGETRLLLQDHADVAAENMAVVLNCWEKLDPERQGLTAAEVIQLLYKQPPDRHLDYHLDLKAALEALLGKPDTRGLGNKLRAFRRRVFQGRFIDHAGTQQRAARWAVYPAEAFGQRLAKTHQTHQTHFPSQEPLATASESGECSECVSANGQVLERTAAVNGQLVVGAQGQLIADHTAVSGERPGDNSTPLSGDDSEVF